jgi:hypothetical protein
LDFGASDSEDEDDLSAYLGATEAPARVDLRVPAIVVLSWREKAFEVNDIKVAKAERATRSMIGQH